MRVIFEQPLSNGSAPIVPFVTPDANGQRAAPLTAATDIRAFGWSPDGRQIVFARLSPDGDPPGGPSAMQLVLLDIETGSLSVLVEGQPWLDRPDWQPAGKD